MLGDISGDFFTNVSGRWTRLGEIAPIVRLFILDSFGKITDIALIIVILYSTVQVMY
jgi:hypothetical protein